MNVRLEYKIGGEPENIGPRGNVSAEKYKPFRMVIDALPIYNGETDWVKFTLDSKKAAQNLGCVLQASQHGAWVKQMKEAGFKVTTAVREGDNGQWFLWAKKYRVRN